MEHLRDTEKHNFKQKKYSLDYFGNVIDYEVIKCKILYIFCNIDKLFAAVYIANFDSFFLYCVILQKENEFRSIWILTSRDSISEVVLNCNIRNVFSS